MAVYLGLGANLGDRVANLRLALEQLRNVGVRIERVSPVFESPAMLATRASPDWNLPFMNVVTRCSTSLSPGNLLEQIKRIEAGFGRDDAARWAPRPIDIDILLWNDALIDAHGLAIPHPGIRERGFVLSPLVSLEPRLTIPGLGPKTVLEWSRELGRCLPLWMGVVNVTPDSFSDGGDKQTWDRAERCVAEMLDAGAHIIDVGGESTRPGAKAISWSKEWQRIEPILGKLQPYRRPGSIGPLISVDTYHPETAERALELGVDIINDVGGLQLPAMLELAAGSDTDWVAMHNLGVPVDRDAELPRDGDPFDYVDGWLARQLDNWDRAGLDLNRVIFDPGIGFGKNSLQSMQLLRRAGEFRRHGLRVLVGHSRKSFMNELADNLTEKDLLTVGASLNLCNQGVDILRVHNVPLHTAAFRGFSHLQS
ncbi:MAG TPA: dihydropteroate synthase [Gammaproteobacteria bacterium]